MLTILPGPSGQDVLLLLGDQIYANDPSDGGSVALLGRALGTGSTADRHADVAEEIQNFEEYTWLYHETWTPAARPAGCLSTCPPGWSSTTTTSATTGTRQLVATMGDPAGRGWPDEVIWAYVWVYQHLGNLQPRPARRRGARPHAEHRG